MKISDLNPHDHGILAEIHNQVFPKSWSQEEFAALLKNTGICGYLARQEDRAVGFILAQVAIDQADILTFCVLPAYQGLGIGRSLLKTIECFLSRHKVKEIILEVAHDNVPAITLYHQEGYIPIGRRKNYYQETNRNAIDAIVMRKSMTL